MPCVGQISGTALEQVTFEWKIRDFFSLSVKSCDWYESSGFNFADSQWHLELCPRSFCWISGHPEGSAAIYLVREDSGPPKTIQYWLGIKVPGGVEKKEQHEREFTSLQYRHGYLLSRSEFKDQTSILMPDNVLTIICCLGNSLSAVRDASAYVDQTVQATFDGQKKLLESLLSMLESGDDSDVIINVRGEEFPAHRSILCSRSPVFRTMFAHDMLEKNSGVVKIEDCDATVFHAFLIHIYSGNCNQISSENVCGLFAAADKYDVGELKEACLEFMKGNITEECFCDVLALSLKHNDEDLIVCLTNFFCDNTFNIIKTTKWQTFLVDNPTGGNELFIKAASKFTVQ